VTRSLDRAVMEIVQDPQRFSRQAGHVELRPYQVPVIEAIADSIRRKRGLSFVVIFSRQSGKNETQLSLYSYLLVLFQKLGGDIIHVEPTYKPQTQTSMARLEARLSANILTRKRWRKRFGYIYQVNLARVVHLSGDESANVVGGTAGLLLSINEAQDIGLLKYDKDFGPMAASTNATRVFWGTRWTNDTLLERELKSAQQAQERDGIRRVFIVDADEVGAVVPAYAEFVRSEVAKRGRQHPLIKTQFYCETIEAQAGMFPPARIMLMRGDHPRQEIPTHGKTYALLVDVGGQDEMSLNPNELDNPARDSTAATIVEISPESITLLQKPTYRTVNRRKWTGQKHVIVFQHIVAMMELWHFQYMVIDATGVGEGLWSMLDARFGERAIPFKFTEQSKSELGYGYLAVVETGRYREYSPMDDTFLEQCEKCRSEARVGASRSLKWGVPDTARRADGQYLHDDELLSAALCAQLDTLEWAIQTKSVQLPAPDLLADAKGY